MDDELRTKLKITIWQPYFAGCMLAIGQRDAQQLDVLDSDTELQREVFTWSLDEDVWAGVTDDQLRTSLAARLINDFQPMLLPDQRDMEHLAAFVSDLRELAMSPASEWSPSASGDQTYSTALMINGLLAFYHQLNWLLDVFSDLPGASVSVR